MNKLKEFQKQVAGNFIYLVLGYVIYTILVPKFPLFFIKNFPTPVRIEDFLWLLIILIGVFSFLNNHIRVSQFTKTFPAKSILIWFIVISASLILNILRNNVGIDHILFIVRFIQYLSLFYLATLFPLTTIHLNKVWVTLSVVTVLVCVWAFLQFYGVLGGFGGGFYGYQYVSATDRVFASFSGPYELAGFLLLMVPIFLGLFIYVRRIWLKIVLLILWFLSILTLGFSGARFPVVVVSVCIIPLLLVHRSWKSFFFLLWIGGLTIIIPLITSETFVDRFTSLTESPDSKITATPVPTSTIIPTNSPTPTIKVIETIPFSPIQATPTSSIPVLNIVSSTPYPTITPTPTIIMSPTPTLEAIPIFDKGTFTGIFFQKVAEQDRSLDLRINTNWPLAWKELLKDPFLGGGLGVNGVGLDGEYVTLLGETGIIGLISFGLMLISFVIYFLRIDSKNPQELLIKGVALSLLTTMIMSAVLSDNFRASKIAITFWFIIGTLMSALNNSQEKS